MTNMTALCVTVCRDPSKNSKVVAVQAPMQTNAYDCGVYVLGKYSFSGRVMVSQQSSAKDALQHYTVLGMKACPQAM